MKEGDLKYLNENRLPQFLNQLGLDLRAGDKTPESGGIPRLFILDEENPSRPRTLEEDGASVGSVKFWELAKQGKLFGYAAGEKDPVQIQLVGNMPGSLQFSEPLSTDKEKLASRNAETGIEKPQYKEVPREVARPGWFARLMHSINSNWYKAENEAYSKNRQVRQSIQQQNQQLKEEYEQKVREARAPLNALCEAVSKGAEAAFGAKRTAEALNAEKEFKTVRTEEARKVKEQAQKDENAAKAEKSTKRIENSVTNMMSVFAPKPKPIQALVGKHYKVASFTKLKPIDLPEGMKIGDAPVTDRLFANLALHAQLDSKGSEIWNQNNHGKSTIPELMEAGLTKQEAEKALIVSSGGMTIDILNKDPRANTDQFFDVAEYGRTRAKEALEEYQQGKKEKLADILVGTAQYMKDTVRSQEYLSGNVTLADAKLANELMDLLDKDEELSALCGKKGLTDDDVEICVGADYLRELEDAKLDAEEKLFKAAAKNQDLDAAEKKKCLHDIFKYRTADAMIHREMKDANSPELMKELHSIDDRTQATMMAQFQNKPLPEGIKPISKDAGPMLALYERTKLKKVPSGLSEMAEYKYEADAAKEEKRAAEPNTLDKLADMTVQSLRLESMDAKTLVDKVTGQNGLTEDKLIAFQGKLALDQAKAEKAKASEAEQVKAVHAEKEADELNTAVLYDEKGRAVN